MSGPLAARNAPSRYVSLTECYANTDLAWRLAQIPDRCASRGAFFNMLDDRAGQLDPETQRVYREFFQLYQFLPFRFYPVKDYLTRIVTLAQIHFGASRIHEGVFEIQAGAFDAWGRTLVGRATLALMSQDFHSVLHGVGKTLASGALVNYGSFALRDAGPGQYVASFVDEYVYIEHAMAGALMGVARACKVDVEMEARMASPFRGEIYVTVRSGT